MPCRRERLLPIRGLGGKPGAPVAGKCGLSGVSQALVSGLFEHINWRLRTSTPRSGQMLPIKGLYEIAIRVKDLARAEAFYKNVLGLEEGLRDDRRNWLFLRAGGDAGMVVLQEDNGDWPTQHFAFAVTETDIKQAAALLKEKGVAVSEPVYHEWINAVSVYFADLDGHQLELLALLGS